MRDVDVLFSVNSSIERNNTFLAIVAKIWS